MPAAVKDVKTEEATDKPQADPKPETKSASDSPALKTNDATNAKVTETKPPAQAAGGYEPGEAKFADGPDDDTADAPVASGGGLNAHAVTVLKAIIGMLTELCGASEGKTAKMDAAAAPAPNAPPGSATAVPAAAPAAVAPVPSYAAAEEPIAQFSDAHLEQIARLTAENHRLRRAPTKSDEQRLEEAIGRFRAERLVVDEAEFIETVRNLGLQGERIDFYAAKLASLSEQAPPAVGEGAAMLGQATIAKGGVVASETPAVRPEAPSEAARFLAADTELEPLVKREPKKFHAAAAEAARLYDGSKALQRFWAATGRSRLEFVEAKVAEAKHSNGSV